MLSMNDNSTKLILCFALFLAGNIMGIGQIIKTEPFTFTSPENDPRGEMELSPKEVILYENARGQKSSFYPFKGEIGDELSINVMETQSKLIRQIQFEYYAALNSFQTGQECIVRIYVNDGRPVSENGPRKPGEMLFQSDAFPVQTGFNMVSISGFSIVVPAGSESITMSVDLLGLSSICRVGLLTNNEPEVGSSSAYCWVNSGTDETPLWLIKEDSLRKFNFSSRISGENLIPSFKIDNNRPREGSTFTIEFINGAKNARDWFGVYNEGVIPGSQAPLIWQYANGSSEPPKVGVTEGQVTLKANLDPGNYNVFYFINDTFDDLGSEAITVLERPSLSALKAEYEYEEPISISFNNGPGKIRDWIEIYPHDVAAPGETDSIAWAFLNGSTTEIPDIGITDGMVVFEPLDPGKYTAYFFEDETSKLLAKSTFTVREREPADWTVMVYAHADHNLTSALMEDLLEMEQAGSSDHFNIITQTDINTKARATKLWEFKNKVNPDDFDGIARLLIGPDTDGKANTFNSSIIERYPEENNMDNPEELKNFVDWSINNYPAKRYGLVLWNHGGQFVGYGGDTQNGTLKHGKGLTSGQIREALLSSLNESGIHKFDFIGFDTCLMGATEVIADFHDLCEIYFGCAELDYGDGWDYGNTLNYLKSNPDIDIRTFALNEVQIWDEHHSYSSMDKTHKVHAAFDMEKFDAFAESFYEFSLLLNDYAKSAENEIPKIRAEATHYSVSSRSKAKSPTHFIDLGDLVDNVATTVVDDESLKSAAQELSANIGQMVLAKAVGSERLNVSALSIAYPHNTEDWNQKYQKLYGNLSFVSGGVGNQWKLFLQYFGLMSQSDIGPPSVNVLNNTKAYSNSNRGFGDAEVDYLTVSLNSPAILDFAVIGDDAFELSATLVLPSPDRLIYDYIGEVGVFRIETPGEYELMWPGTNPMITSSSADNWLDLGAWYTNRESNQMISFADYQPPGSGEKIQLFLFSEFDSNGIGILHTILEDSGQELPDSEAVAATPASSSLQLEPGGKLWPIYYSEAWDDETQEWAYSEFFFEEGYITIPEAGIDEIYLQYNQAIGGDYSLEIQVTDYFGNRSQYVDYNITVPDTGEVSENNQFVSKLEYVGEYKREMPALKTGRYIDDFADSPDEMDPEFISFIYVEWSDDGTVGDKLQSSSSVKGPWQDVADEFIDYYGEEYVYWTETVGDMQYFRITGQQ